MPHGPQATIVQLDVFPTLTVISGEPQGQRYPVIGERVVMGRRNGDLVIADPEISSTHCEIFQGGKRYFVRDLGSTNGTYVNGKQIRESRLRSGDQLGIGRTILAFDLAEADPPSEQVSSSETVSGVDKRISVGIYDHLPEFNHLGALVDDELVGFDDPEGTEVFDPTQHGLSCRLPVHSVVQLELKGGPEKGREITFETGSVVIGRFGTEVILKDPDVSRRHLSIQVFGRDQIFLRDMGSTNGCYVNGVKVKFCKLQSGDTLVLGRTVMQLAVKDLN